MKDKAPIIVLIIVAVGLAIGLIVVNNKASEQKREADNSIRSLSNIVVSTKATLAEYQSVNQTLETNLIMTKTEASNKLSLSEANLHSTEAELEKARAEAKAQAEADATAMAQRDKKITDLQNQNVDLDKKAAELRATIASLDTQIVDTKKKLAETQGDRTLLLAELKRLQARQAELEKKFHDLAALRLEIRKLKEEATLARQLDWMRRGVYASFGEKGGERLIKHTAETAPPPATNAQLNVEIHQSGAIKIQPAASTNSPAPTNSPAK